MSNTVTIKVDRDILSRVIGLANDRACELKRAGYSENYFVCVQHVQGALMDYEIEKIDRRLLLMDGREYWEAPEDKPFEVVK